MGQNLLKQLGGAALAVAVTFLKKLLHAVVSVCVHHVQILWNEARAFHAQGFGIKLRPCSIAARKTSGREPFVSSFTLYPRAFILERKGRMHLFYLSMKLFSAVCTGNVKNPYLAEFFIQEQLTYCGCNLFREKVVIFL